MTPLAFGALALAVIFAWWIAPWIAGWVAEDEQNAARARRLAREYPPEADEVRASGERKPTGPPSDAGAYKRAFDGR